MYIAVKGPYCEKLRGRKQHTDTLLINPEIQQMMKFENAVLLLIPLKLTVARSTPADSHLTSYAQRLTDKNIREIKRKALVITSETSLPINIATIKQTALEE